MKPQLKVIEGRKNYSDDPIIAAIRPLGREVMPSPEFLRRTRNRLLLLGSAPVKRSQAA